MSKRSFVVAALVVLAGGALAQSPPKSEKPTAQMQKVLDALKALGAQPPSAGTLRQAREGVTVKDAVRKVLQDQKLPIEPEKIAKVEQRTIPSPGGDLAVTIYTPEGQGPFPAVVYFHGGGFVLADAAVYDASARGIANQAQAVVVSVDYRRAPEDTYAAAPDDASAAFTFVREHPEAFNIQPSKVAVAGESAGANLATVVAMRAKKEGTALPVYQVLIYPFLSNKLDSASHRANGSGKYIVGNKDLAWFWSNYLGDAWQEYDDPQALPLQASRADLIGLPPALVITANLDPLRDDGFAYVKKLREAGVQVKLRNYRGVTHEFFQMVPVLDEAKQAHAEVGSALRAAFARAGQVGAR